MEITITKIHRADKDKEGKAYVTKDGRPYTRLGLQTKEHGTSWLSGFDNYTTKNWKEGDTVDVEVTKVSSKDGKEYLNFKMVSENDKLWKMCAYLQQQINDLKKGQADVLRNFGQVPDDEVGKVNEELSEVKEVDLPF